MAKRPRRPRNSSNPHHSPKPGGMPLAKGVLKSDPRDIDRSFDQIYHARLDAEAERDFIRLKREVESDNTREDITLLDMREAWLASTVISNAEIAYQLGRLYNRLCFHLQQTLLRIKAYINPWRVPNYIQFEAARTAFSELIDAADILQSDNEWPLTRLRLIKKGFQKYVMIELEPFELTEQREKAYAAEEQEQLKQPCNWMRPRADSSILPKIEPPPPPHPVPPIQMSHHFIPEVDCPNRRHFTYYPDEHAIYPPEHDGFSILRRRVIPPARESDLEILSSHWLKQIREGIEQLIGDPHRPHLQLGIQVDRGIRVDLLAIRVDRQNAREFGAGPLLDSFVRAELSPPSSWVQLVQRHATLCGIDVGFPSPDLKSSEALQSLVNHCDRVIREALKPTLRPLKSTGARLVLANDVNNPFATLDGSNFAIDSDGHTFLSVLLASGGDWVTSREIKTQAVGQRVDRILKKLPPALRAIVESKRGTGYRIKR